MTLMEIDINFKRILLVKRGYLTTFMEIDFFSKLLYYHSAKIEKYFSFYKYFK